MTERRLPPEGIKRRWYALAQRHRRMAERLRRDGFTDGAVFYAYHAYECAISALIAARGLPVPASHSGRLALFERLRDPTRPYAATQNQLDQLSIQTRNASLYYDEGDDAMPTERLDLGFAELVLPIVHRFAREVWADIG